MPSSDQRVSKPDPPDPEPPDVHFNQTLTETLINCHKDTGSTDPLPKRFFKRWFIDPQETYFFLFRQNLSVTDIQFAELLALLKSYVRPAESYNPVPDYQFLSTTEIKDLFTDLTKSFSIAKDDDDSLVSSQVSAFVNTYGPPIRRLVLVRSFFGSCFVALPPHLCFPGKSLGKLCAVAGYIYSCGRNVFVRRVDKADPQQFIERLSEYLSSTKGRPSSGKKRFFTVFAHEDFISPGTSMAKRGLDEVKIYVEKFYMHTSPLAHVISDIASQCSSSLIVSDPSVNWQAAIQTLRDNQQIDRTIFLITDRSIGADTLQPRPGPDRYYICHDQLYQNDHPFHRFDEDKPAWVCPITLPHTLASAMINITRPFWPRDEEDENDTSQLTFADVCVGSGTTWFEAGKYKILQIAGSDLNPVVKILVSDNKRFFSMNSDRLLQCVEFLESVRRVGLNNTDAARAIGLIREAHLEATDGMFTAEAVQKLLTLEVTTLTPLRHAEDSRFIARLLVWIGLRTYFRGKYALLRARREFPAAFDAEMAAQCENIRRYITFSKAFEEANTEQSADETDRLREYTGLFSPLCRIAMVELLDETSISVKNAVTELKGTDQFDIIVTDPPYGFNTRETLAQQAENFTNLIRKCVGLVRHNGQLVLCLPDKSLNGQPLPYLTSYEVVFQQVLSEAQKLNKEVITPVVKYPKPRSVFRPPYYWESEKALRRKIVHFQIRSRQ